MTLKVRLKNKDTNFNYTWKKDRIVPFKMGKKLYELANNPKFFYSTQEDDHMMQFNEQLMKSIKNFLDFNT